MAASLEHDKRPGPTSTRTPSLSPVRGPPTVGSSCTWTRKELDLFGVRIERDVPVEEMVPERYFEFGGLEGYELCTFP